MHVGRERWWPDQRLQVKTVLIASQMGGADKSTLAATMRESLRPGVSRPTRKKWEATMAKRASLASSPIAARLRTKAPEPVAAPSPAPSISGRAVPADVRTPDFKTTTGTNRAGWEAMSYLSI